MIYNSSESWDRFTKHLTFKQNVEELEEVKTILQQENEALLQKQGQLEEYSGDSVSVRLSLEQDVNALKEDIRYREEQYDIVVEERDNLTSKLEEMEQCRLENEEQQKTSNSDLSNMKKQLEQEDQQLLANRSQIQDLSTELQSFREAIGEKVLEITQLKEALSSQCVEDKEKKILELEKTVEYLTSEQENIEKESTNVILAKDVSIQELRDQVSSLEEEISDIRYSL